ncbi:hypothetical protein NDU88_002916 [Pleurodeles waltl]|uniref:DDE Tnp4 domain-containing protein n=1 Tax=Pleurodeles waltl TaxID=8319 RepID=A0AAV7UZW1_PLEWA|nr:hypothetical protein NDU88_002916 [Pleurodeles waltl]
MLGGHPQLSLRRLLAAAENVLPSLKALGAPSLVCPPGSGPPWRWHAKCPSSGGTSTRKEEQSLPTAPSMHHQLGHMRRWRNPPVYRPLVDLLTMEERHIIVTYRFDRATIQELCTQLEPDLMSSIRHPTGIPPDVQVLSEQVYRNRKNYHSMNVQMVCMADQYISQVNAMFPGSVHDAYILRYSSIPDMMGQLQRHHVWLLGDSGYPNLSWLLTPVRNPRTRTEERYNDAHGWTRRVIKRTFCLLKARFRCLYMTGGSLFYSPKKVCDIIIACSMLHNLALRRQVPFLQEDDPDDGVVAAVESVERVDSDEDEAEDEENDNRESVIQQYFQ